jgi:hypothetical protein
MLLLCLLTLATYAQNYSIPWYKVAGGGGVSAGTNGASVFSVAGTVGQPEAGGSMTGGNFSVSGGFWSIVSVVPTPGAPILNIAYSGGSVIVSWPYPSSGFVLQQSSNLSATSWAVSSFTIVTNGSSNQVTITSPTGSLFLRLSNP